MKCIIQHKFRSECLFHWCDIKPHSRMAHCRAFKVLTFIEKLQVEKFSSELTAVLTQLCELYSVYWLLNGLGHFLMYSSLQQEDVAKLYDWQDSLLAALRPNAVGIVDSFDICDKILSSPLGAYDGNVYERLFEAANESPLNKKPVDDSFHKYLKPFLKSNL